MTLDRAIRLARSWAFGGCCTLAEGEAQEYHKMALEAMEELQTRKDDRHLIVLPCLPGERVWVFHPTCGMPYWTTYESVSEIVHDMVRGYTIGTSREDVLRKAGESHEPH